MNPFEKKLEQKAEAKKELEPVKTEEVKQDQAPLNLSVVSDIDLSIIDRFKSAPKTLEEVDAKVVEKPADGKHRLSLPEELEPYTKKYAFCWIYKKKRAIDEACDQLHWVLVNKTYFPDLPPHLFSARGAMERGDEILAFRSKAVDEEMRKAPGLESTEKIKARFEAHKDDPTYYIPEAEHEVGPDGKMRKIPVVGV